MDGGGRSAFTLTKRTCWALRLKAEQLTAVVTIIIVWKTLPIVHWNMDNCMASTLTRALVHTNCGHVFQLLLKHVMVKKQLWCFANELGKSTLNGQDRIFALPTIQFWICPRLRLR